MEGLRTGLNPKVPACHSGRHLSFPPGPSLLRNSNDRKDGRQEGSQEKVPDDVGFEKEREREREGGEDIETEWNDLKLIYVWWKEHQLG